MKKYIFFSINSATIYAGLRFLILVEIHKINKYKILKLLKKIVNFIAKRLLSFRKMFNFIINVYLLHLLILINFY